MNLEFRKSFARDLKKKSKEPNLRMRVREIIQEVDNAEGINKIKNHKKLKAEGNYYRIRSGNYSIGLTIEADTACFIRMLHRNEIYRYFP